MSATLCVLGALQRDPPARPAGSAPVRPGAPGDFALFGGGKGANQALAASRLGARVMLVGSASDDEHGQAVRGALASEGVDLTYVGRPPPARAGVTPASCAEGVTIEDVDRASSAIAAAGLLLVQGELVPEVTLHAMELARNSSTLVLYHAAPARALPESFLRQVDLLVARPDEALELVGDATSEIGPPGIVRRLASLGPERVVLFLGSDGSYHFDGHVLAHVEACAAASPAALARDVTGADDAFVAALAVLRAEGVRMKDAVRFACAAGTLAASVRGVVTSLPSRDAVEALVRRGKGARG